MPAHSPLSSLVPCIGVVPCTWAETDGHGAELTEPVPRPTRGKALPLELSVVAITKATEPERP